MTETTIPDAPTAAFLDVTTRDTGDIKKEFKDATIKGVIDRALLDRPVTVAGSADGKFSQTWINRNVTFGFFLEQLCAFRRGAKDGSAFLQGALNHVSNIGPRKGVHLVANALLVLDADAGYTLDEILAKLPEKLFCAIYTTHSHLKTTTTLNRKGLQLYRQQQGRTGEPTEEDAREYLLNVKRCKPALLERATYVFAGKLCTITHAPCPRYRIVFLLARPFSLLTEAERDLWTRTYLALADQYGLVVDESCSDPAKLFYWPRIAEGAVIVEDAHEILIYAGEALDLDSVEVPPAPEPKARQKKERQPGSTTTGGSAAQPGEFQTLHMKRFLGMCGDSFMAADCIKTLAPDEIRHEYTGNRAGQIDATCPMTGGHDPANRCFHVRNAKPDDEFTIWCKHDDCKTLAAKENGKQDRGKFLDAWCMQHGIKSAAELLDFCDDAARASWPPDRFAAFEEIEELETCDDDDDDAGGDFFSDARRAVEASNVSSPTLFVRDDGGYMRINSTGGKFRVEELNGPAWSFELYSRAGPGGGESGEWKGSEIAVMKGATDWRLPIFDALSYVPTFGPDGKLRTTSGYDASTRTFLAPGFDFVPLPATITREHVNAAVYLLRECVIDLPFSDSFGEVDKLPIYTANRDRDGWPIPNPARGRSSFAHWLAMVLQPYCRQLISGGVPIYNVDAPTNGDGKTYSTHPAGILFSGEELAPTPLADNQDERRKALVATLRKGLPYTLFDNVNAGRLIDFPDLAAATTASRYVGRELGVSHDVDVKVAGSFIFTGCGTEFSAELKRRNVPIKLDFGREDPTTGRVFKHNFKNFLH